MNCSLLDIAVFPQYVELKVEVWGVRQFPW